MSKKQKAPETVDSENSDNTLENHQENNIDEQATDAEIETESTDVTEVDAALLKSQLDEAKDQYLRAKAEMENIRRRADKQITDSRKFAIEGFAKELLGVRDSLQLAVEVEIEAEDSDAVKSMKEGLNLTLKQLDGVFNNFSIQEIAPVTGDKLDPNRHQAITMVPSEEVASGCIVTTVQKGYELNERLLRPAMVTVAKVADE